MGRGQPPKVPCGGRHRPQVRRAGTASHLPAERAHSPPPSRLRPGPRLPFRTRPHLEPHPGPGRGGEGRPREGTWPGGSAGRRRGPEARARRNEAMARSPGGRCALLLLLQLLTVVSAVNPAPRPERRRCPHGGDSAGPNLRRVSRVGRIRARAQSLSPHDRHTQVPMTFPNWDLWVR